MIDKKLENKLKRIFGEYDWYEDIVVSYNPATKEYMVIFYYKFTRLFSVVIDKTRKILESEIGKVVEYEIGCIDNGKLAIGMHIKRKE